MRANYQKLENDFGAEIPSRPYHRFGPQTFRVKQELIHQIYLLIEAQQISLRSMR